MFDETFHALNVICQSFSASGRDFISGFWPQADECFFARDVPPFFQFAEMQIQTAVNCVEPFFQRREIKRAVHLQRCHDAKSNWAVNGGVEAVEINGWLFHLRKNFSIADEE